MICNSAFGLDKLKEWVAAMRLGATRVLAAATHAFVGAGEGPCTILAASSRQFQATGDWGGYSADETAAKYATPRSILLPTRVAMRTPTSNPIIAVMIDDVVSNNIVFGSRSSTISETRVLPSVVRNCRASPKSSFSTRNT